MIPKTKISVIQGLNDILSTAIRLDISDIHFETYESEFRVRFRKDGSLYRYCLLPYMQKDEFTSRLKILAELDIAEKRISQDGKFVYRIDRKRVDIRISVLPTQFGEKIVLRILDQSSLQLELDHLGFDPIDLNSYKTSIKSPQGMILVTGPTGSGKTTTLYASLNEIYSEETNITTIEDPIEYNLFGINQTHVRPDIGFTFSKALRSILRQDPEIIMIGEMRDKETADIAVRSALTGHLVFSTLHTNDAPSTILRLLNMGIEPYLITSSVKLVIAQRLVRKNCEYCLAPYDPDQKILSKLDLPPNHKYYKGTGCDKCNGTGFRGRTAIFEIMNMNEGLSDIIMKDCNLSELRRNMILCNMTPLLEGAKKKILGNFTTPDEIFQKVYSSI